MSAPDTNVSKQADRHKTPLFGMGAVVAFAGALFLLLIVWLSVNGNEPGEAGTIGAAASVASDG